MAPKKGKGNKPPEKDAVNAILPKVTVCPRLPIGSEPSCLHAMVEPEDMAPESGEEEPSNPTPGAARGGLRIEKTFIDGLPEAEWNGPIELVERENEAELAIRTMMNERILGFDTETKPCHRRGEYHLPSVLQLATSDRVFVFRIEACGGIPFAFPVLCNPRVAKVGIAVRDDVRNLMRRAPFDAHGFIEISDYSRKAGVENTGLRALAAHYLGFQMKKSKRVQISDWSRRLDKRQVQYAANDAWVGRELFLKLESTGIVPKF
jgi:hypothetical protein